MSHIACVKCQYILSTYFALSWMMGCLTCKRRCDVFYRPYCSYSTSLQCQDLKLLIPFPSTPLYPNPHIICIDDYHGQIPSRANRVTLFPKSLFLSVNSMFPCYLLNLFAINVNNQGHTYPPLKNIQPVSKVQNQVTFCKINVNFYIL